MWWGDQVVKVGRDRITQGLRGKASLQERGRKKGKSLEFTLLEEVSNPPAMFSLETEDLGEGKSTIISTGQLSHVWEVSFISTPTHRA